MVGAEGRAGRGGVKGLRVQNEDALNGGPAALGGTDAMQVLHGDLGQLRPRPLEVQGQRGRDVFGVEDQKGGRPAPGRPELQDEVRQEARAAFHRPHEAQIAARHALDLRLIEEGDALARAVREAVDVVGAGLPVQPGTGGGGGQAPLPARRLPAGLTQGLDEPEQAVELVQAVYGPQAVQEALAGEVEPPQAVPGHDLPERLVVVRR